MGTDALGGSINVLDVGFGLGLGLALLVVASGSDAFRRLGEFTQDWGP